MADDITRHPNYCYLSGAVILPDKTIVREIKWINSNEKMPPDDKSILITKYPPGGYIKLTGEVIKDISNKRGASIEYIAYDEETWKRLNNGNVT